MTTLIKSKTTKIMLKSQEAIEWIEDNISLSSKQWDKDDDTGNPIIMINTEFVDELLDEMEEELKDGIDYKVI